MMGYVAAAVCVDGTNKETKYNMRSHWDPDKHTSACIFPSYDFLLGSSM